jgi:hypothetical protein
VAGAWRRARSTVRVPDERRRAGRLAVGVNRRHVLQRSLREDCRHLGRVEVVQTHRHLVQLLAAGVANERVNLLPDASFRPGDGGTWPMTSTSVMSTEASSLASRHSGGSFRRARPTTSLARRGPSTGGTARTCLAPPSFDRSLASSLRELRYAQISDRGSPSTPSLTALSGPNRTRHRRLVSPVEPPVSISDKTESDSCPAVSCRCTSSPWR